MAKHIRHLTKKYSTSRSYRRFFELSLTIGGCISLIIAARLVIITHPYYAMAFILPLSFSFVRCFIIQHDCSHGALFTRRSINNWLGRFMSIITFTPFTFWRWNHLVHHKTSSNLDKRGTGDINMLTIDE